MKYKSIIEGNWYEPLHYIRNKKNVVEADLINTTSSAGDWDGYLIEKQNSHYVLKFWSQENRAFGGTGFNLYVGERVISGNVKPSAEDVAKCYELETW
jgi:hypothetical protein